MQVGATATAGTERAEWHNQLIWCQWMRQTGNVRAVAHRHLDSEQRFRFSPGPNSSAEIVSTSKEITVLGIGASRPAAYLRCFCPMGAFMALLAWPTSALGQVTNEPPGEGATPKAEVEPANSTPDNLPSQADGESSSAQCVPSCRDGFMCHLGTCISACNPPCTEGGKCIGDGQCVAVETTTTPPPAQPSAPSTGSSLGEDGGALTVVESSGEPAPGELVRKPIDQRTGFQGQLALGGAYTAVTEVHEAGDGSIGSGGSVQTTTSGTGALVTARVGYGLGGGVLFGMSFGVAVSNLEVETTALGTIGNESATDDIDGFMLSTLFHVQKYLDVFYLRAEAGVLSARVDADELPSNWVVGPGFGIDYPLSWWWSLGGAVTALWGIHDSEEGTEVSLATLGLQLTVTYY